MTIPQKILEVYKKRQRRLQAELLVAHERERNQRTPEPEELAFWLDMEQEESRQVINTIVRLS